MSKLELEWSFTKDEYSAIMEGATAIGATHLFAFKERAGWIDGDGDPKNDIYEKLDNGIWFHYDEVKWGEGAFEWNPAPFSFNERDTIPLHQFYKYIGREEEVAVPSTNMELKEALLVVLKAGFTVVPPQTKG